MLQRTAKALVWPVVWAMFLGAGAVANGGDAPLMARIFANHVVLQRDRPIDVWGQAKPAEEVTVTLSGATRSTRADANGRWQLAMPELPAGGPHTLTARTATQLQNADDVLVGDVWLCSGQSNMEWAVRSSLNADAEVAQSANDSIRHVTIARSPDVAPRADFDAPIEWKIAGPSTTQHFSAVCYYFARELQKSINVPMGLINSSWGGTRIETWLSAGALRTLGGHDANLDLLGERAKDPAVADRHWGETWQKWWVSQPATRGITPWTGGRDSGSWRPAPGQLGHWEMWGEPALAAYDGMVWYRAHVKLSAAQAKQAATLELGTIDDVGLAWINGRAMASGFGEEQSPYSVPAKLLRAGDNAVVVNVFDMWGNGGLRGPADKLVLRFADGSSAPLSDIEYQLPPPGLSPPRAPWEPIAGINILYNGMIAPLGKFGLRGALWYQGEANAGLADALRYEKQLTALFADWRRQFNSSMSFFVVQLANYGPLVNKPVDSGWARLRDAQRRAVAADSNAGLAVAIDIGNRDDIHPANKQEVGRRLARAARHVTYGEKTPASGAQPKAARREGNGVVVSLGDFGGALHVIGARDPAGFELCGNDQASCRFARAQLGADGIVKLENSAGGPATRVRFCWADSPLCNLYDGDELPVGPFELVVN
jgi:sialate O-acetylesterase